MARCSVLMQKAWESRGPMQANCFSIWVGTGSYRTGWWVLAMRNLEATLPQQGLSHPAERGCGMEVTTGLDNKELHRKHHWWGGFGVTWPKMGYVVVVGMANPTSLSELCHSRARFLSSSGLIAEPPARACCLAGSQRNESDQVSPTPSPYLAWFHRFAVCLLPLFLLLLPSPCFCLILAAAATVVHFILFTCHIQGRRQEELGEGKPWQSVQVCVSVCVWVCEHISRARAKAGWFLLGCLSSERGGESAKYHLSKGAASQGVGNLPSLQSSEKCKSLIQVFHSSPASSESWSNFSQKVWCSLGWWMRQETCQVFKTDHNWMD